MSVAAWQNRVSLPRKVTHALFCPVNLSPAPDEVFPLRRCVVHRVALISLLVPVIASVGPAFGQSAANIKDLKLRDWEPRSMMVTKVSVVETPAFPVIDVHNHLGGGKNFLTPERVGRYLAELKAAGVKTVVNLDGGWDERLKETLAALDEAHPGRFLTFALVDFSDFDDEGWSARETKRLEEGFQAGAKGLKFYKQFGLNHRHKDGRLI